MIQNPKSLIEDFRQAIQMLDLKCGSIEVESQPAPHQPHKLPSGKCAVYVFSITDQHACPAGAHRVLKIGKVGPNSNARFQYQHYNPSSASSTLSGSLLNGKIFWRYLSISRMNILEVGDWIKDNTDRDNFYLLSKDKAVLELLERYLRGTLSPVFEG